MAVTEPEFSPGAPPGSRSETKSEQAFVEPPDVDHLVTEDDTPVDNLPSEKQQRLLTESLYSAWNPHQDGAPRPFLAAANVGIFPSVNRPPLVPDVFLALDVEIASDWWNKRHRSYFAWEFGKVPDVVIEIVSNREGNETGSKLVDYARMGVPYYAIYDPMQLVQSKVLQVFSLHEGAYRLRPDHQLPGVGLGLTLWTGVFEGKLEQWLRWCDERGAVVPTGSERAAEERARAEQERARAEQERARAEQERARADQENERANRLAARLRALGIDPDQLD